MLPKYTFRKYFSKKLKHVFKNLQYNFQSIMKIQNNLFSCIKKLLCFALNTFLSKQKTHSPLYLKMSKSKLPFLVSLFKNVNSHHWPLHLEQIAAVYFWFWDYLSTSVTIVLSLGQVICIPTTSQQEFGLNYFANPYKNMKTLKCKFHRTEQEERQKIYNS